MKMPAATLSIWESRRLGWFEAAMAAATIALSGIALAETRTPVYVSVIGEGVVRVKVAEPTIDGPECDDNKVLFKGTIAAGQSTWVQSNTACVCVQHTYGTFRDVQWSLAQLHCPICRQSGCETFMRVVIPTDRP